MQERLSPYTEIISGLHESRGTFEECTYLARINSIESIDLDPSRRTAKVSIDISNTGITFQPGDRVSIMPMNNSFEIEKVVRACGLSNVIDKPVLLNYPWQRFAGHVNHVYRKRSCQETFSVSEILLLGKLAPMTKDMLVAVRIRDVGN
jgi:sulfite reductase alpha subunit-like flavoprotein